MQQGEPLQRDLPNNLSEGDRREAAELIQKTFRGHRARRELQGHSLSPTTKWLETIRDAKYQQSTEPRAPGETADPHQKWKRVTDIARHAGAEDSSDSNVSEHEASDSDPGVRQGRSKEDQKEREQRKAIARDKRKKTAKVMDLQYFLEMVDHKHRYGSNLRKYHAHWKTQQKTNQNFFYWLDQGEGKDFEHEECSRARLEQEQVRYLSREERLKYLVNINKQGQLVWAKNGQLVWTKDELYRDSVEGIVPLADPAAPWDHNVRTQYHENPYAQHSDSEHPDSQHPDSQHPDSQHPDSQHPASAWEHNEQTEHHDDPDSQSDSTSSEDGNEDSPGGLEGERYVNESFHRARGPAKLKHVNAAVLFNHMIRQSLKKGHKWIFVADTSFRMYIGYKQSGAFQHSSFLNGGRILSAGLIKVKDGQLRRLSPLSGHYRPPAANFRAFVHSLEDAGCDMSHVSISRSYAILVGLEGYVKTRKRIKNAEKAVEHQVDKAVRPEKVKAEKEAQQDHSQSAQREREYLEKKRREDAQREDKRHRRGISKRIANAWQRLSGRTVGEDNQVIAEQNTGPEGGVPAPEGHRHLETKR